MANHYSKGGARACIADSATDMQRAVEEFLVGCRQPGYLEHGDELIVMRRGEWTMEIQSGRLTLHVLSAERSVSRRIVLVESRKSASLHCLVERFGGRTAKLTLVDVAKPQSAAQTLHGQRLSFGEQFRRMLQREFPDWQVTTLTSEMDLTRSFSPVFPRAILERRSTTLAAVACPSRDDEASLLTFALVWHDHVRRRCAARRPDAVGPLPLALFLPDGGGQLTAQRLRQLNQDMLPCRLFRFNQHGSAGEVDLQDLGNLESSLLPRQAAASLGAAERAMLERLITGCGVSAVCRRDGSLSLRVNGLEFAQVHQGRFRTAKHPGGIPSRNSPAGDPFLSGETLTPNEVEALAAELSQRRHAGAPDRRHPLYRGSPECWLDAAVRANLELIDANLLPDRLHGEVLAQSGLASGRADLLAISRDGRLAVLELKVVEDIHLPLQALDYWMRIAFHSRAGELDNLFPGMTVLREEPKLLLVAPAICFHPATDIILRYFPSNICVERVGLNLEWQDRLRVVLRLSGCRSPVSHEVLNNNERHRDGWYSECSSEPEPGKST